MTPGAGTALYFLGANRRIERQVRRSAGLLRSAQCTVSRALLLRRACPSANAGERVAAAATGTLIPTLLPENDATLRCGWRMSTGQSTAIFPLPSRTPATQLRGDQARASADRKLRLAGPG